MTKRIPFLVAVMVLACVVMVVCIRDAIGIVWRNQAGIAVVRTLAAQTGEGFWPYASGPDLSQAPISMEPLAPFSVLSEASLADQRESLLNGIQGILSQDWRQAERDLEEVLAYHSGDPLAHFWLGVVQQNQGNQEQAISHWAQADALAFLLQLGGSEMRKGRYAQAREWYTRALAVTDLQGKSSTLDGDLGQAYRDLGRLEWDQGHVDQATQYYEGALREQPYRTLFLYELAQLYSLQDRFDDAIPLVHTLMRLEPDAASWPSVLGSIYQQSEQPTLAEQAYLQAVQTGAEENPDDRCWQARSWLGLSSVYASDLSWQRSFNAALQAVEANQGMSSGWSEQLRNTFDGVLAAAPEQQDWYLAIGDMYQHVGDVQSAQDYFGRAAQRWPDSVETLQRLKDIPEGGIIAKGICP